MVPIDAQTGEKAHEEYRSSAQQAFPRPECRCVRGERCEKHPYVWEQQWESPPNVEQNAPAKIRTFNTGATRDTDTNKLDYDGFLSPLVLQRYAEYMHSNRRQSDGSLRDSDNWQKGIPVEAYRKSLWRHFMEAWRTARGWAEFDLEIALCAMLFNVSGWLHEIIRERRQRESNGEFNDDFEEILR